MSNQWITFVKQWAKDNKCSYASALKNAEMKSEYQKQNTKPIQGLGQNRSIPFNAIGPEPTPRQQRRQRRQQRNQRVVPDSIVDGHPYYQDNEPLTPLQTTDIDTGFPRREVSVTPFSEGYVGERIREPRRGETIFTTAHSVTPLTATATNQRGSIGRRFPLPVAQEVESRMILDANEQELDDIINGMLNPRSRWNGP